MAYRTTGREVGRRFAEGLAASNSNGQLYTDGVVIYSYGPHWPLAAWIGAQLHINDDKISVTTSKHRSFVISGLACQGHRSALDNAVHWPSTEAFKDRLRRFGRKVA